MDDTMPYARKFGRAMKHLDELRGVLDAYKQRDPYVAVRDTDTNSDPRVWIHRTKLTEDPDPNTPLIVGDFLHNLRASLDYAVVAIAPNSRKRKAKFPIETDRIWELDPNTGEYVARFENSRQSFLSSIKGIPEEAQTFIQSIQPYIMDEPSAHYLAQLNTFNNADKHASLIPISLGIENPTTSLIVVTKSGHTLTVVQRIDGVFRVGDIISNVSIRPKDLNTLPDDHPMRNPGLVDALNNAAEVNVELTGQPTVGIEMPSFRQFVLRLPLGLEKMAQVVRDHVLERLDTIRIAATS